ncbi:MAG: hypothetical protein EZS28_056558, partial [Streblomastix strix]
IFFELDQLPLDELILVIELSYYFLYLSLDDSKQGRNLTQSGRYWLYLISVYELPYYFACAFVYLIEFQLDGLKFHFGSSNLIGMRVVDDDEEEEEVEEVDKEEDDEAGQGNVFDYQGEVFELD